MGVAQFGSALEWGSRGRGFKSLHPYQQKDNPVWVVFFVYSQSFKMGLERVGIAYIKKAICSDCFFYSIDLFSLDCYK